MKREISVEDDLVSEYRAAVSILDERGHLEKVELNIEQVRIPDWWAEKRVVITRQTIIETGHDSGTFWPESDLYEIHPLRHTPIHIPPAAVLQELSLLYPSPISIVGIVPSDHASSSFFVWGLIIFDFFS